MVSIDMETTSHGASFLDLPVELRLDIYQYYFMLNSPRPLAQGHLPSILSVSKQLYTEAIDLYFSTTTFTFWSNSSSFSRTLLIYCNLPSRHKNSIKCLRYPTIYPVSTYAAAALVPLNQAWQAAAEYSITLPPGMLQVGVRSRDGEVVWTDDPEALLKEWKA